MRPDTAFIPRGSRLDVPGVLQHANARGIGRRKLFLDNHDRDDFLRRVAALTDAGALAVYAWAVMPTHFHCGANRLAPTASQHALAVDRLCREF